MTTTVLETPPELSIKEDSGLKGINVVDEDQGIVEAFVSVTGIPDRVNDIIVPGAYTKTLATRTPKGLVGHDWKSLVSKALEVKELLPGDAGLPKTLSNGDPWPAGAGALRVKAQYNLNTERGRDAFQDAKFFGSDQEWSIGYSVPKTKEASYKDSKGVRHINHLDLFEFSQVLWGAMPHARTSSVKDADIEIEVKDGQTSLKEPMTLDGKLPISDIKSLTDTLELVAAMDPAMTVDIKAHIKRAASALGATDMLPDKWNDKADDDADSEHKNDEEIVTGDSGGETVSLPTLSETTIEAEGNMKLDLAVQAFKALGAFLHAEKVISDELFTKVTGEVLEAKVDSFETMSDVAEGMGNVFGDDAAKFLVLAGKYDTAIESENADLIASVESKVAGFIASHMDAAESDETKSGIRAVAQAMVALQPEEIVEEEDEDKDDQDDEQETKADVVVMTQEELMAQFAV